jgi:hypothetical protein
MTLKNIKKLPKEIIPVLQDHAQILFGVLSKTLTGIYVHG